MEFNIPRRPDDARNGQRAIDQRLADRGASGRSMQCSAKTQHWSCLPGSALWHKINPRTGTPTNAVWLAAVAAFVLGIPSLWSTVAFGAITSIATIGLYISYVTPILLRRIYPRNFEPGPWHLGRWSGVLGWIAVVWVCIITVLFCLPEVNPVTWTTFNYAPIAVGAVLVFSGTWWLISARKWFTGPHRQGDEAQLRALEGATAQLEGTS